MASRVPYPFHLVSTVDVPGTYRYKGKVISRHLTRLAADYAANRPYLRGTCEVVENTEYEEQKAVRVNQARLLAAAPEMLLIIEEIVNYFNRRLLDTRKAWGWLDIARAIEAAHNIQPPKGEA